MRNDESATFVLNAPNLAGQQVTLSLTDATNGQQTRVMTMVGTTTVFQWTHDAPATRPQTAWPRPAAGPSAPPGSMTAQTQPALWVPRPCQLFLWMALPLRYCHPRGH